MNSRGDIGTWLHRGILILLLAAGAAAVCYRSAAPTMWVDEVAARSDGLGPLRGLLRSADPHVSSAHAYHIINRACEWVTGDIHYGNRLPQALAAWGSLIFIYVLARQCFSPGAGLLAILLLITHPFFIRYAQENRLQQMVSCGMLASLYFSVQYLYRRRVGHLAGFIISMALLVRCGYGILPLCVLCIVWPVMYLVALRSRARIEGRAVAECYAAVLIVLALWLPYPFMFARDMLDHGMFSSVTRGLPVLDHFWQGAVALTPQAVAAYCGRHFAEALNWQTGILLLALALIGSAYYRRLPAWSVVLFTVIVTLLSFHAMNRVHGGIVPRRYVYLCPLTMFVIAGGVAMAVALGTDACSALFVHVWGVPHERMRRAAHWLVRPALWLAVGFSICWPLLSDHAYQLSQYYFTDRHVYRTMAHVLNTCAQAGAEVISVDTDTRDWALSMYAKPGAWQPPRLYLTQSWYDKPASFTPNVLARAFSSSTEVWITHLDPADYGYSSNWYVRVPCGESWRYGTLTCIKPEYVRTAALRGRDAAAAARVVVYGSAYPRILCATFLTELLLRQGRTNAADAVMQHIGRYHWSYAATRAAEAYFAGRGNAAAAHAYRAAFARRMWWRRLRLPGLPAMPAAWPEQFAWFDYTDFGLAADVTGIARPEAWLGPRRAKAWQCSPPLFAARQHPFTP